MKSSDDLFQLVKSLSKSEKRYFKLLALKKPEAGAKNNYLRLFDVLDKMDVYDEAKVKKRFAGEALARHLPSEKSYLYNLILKSLHLFYIDSSEETGLDELIHFTKILFSKGLYQQSAKLAQKAQKIARKGELFPHVYKIARYQIRLAGQLAVSAGELEAGISHAVADLHYSTGKLINLNRYYELQGRFFYLMRRGGEQVRNAAELEEFDAIMADPLMKEEEQALSTEAKELFCWINSAYQYMLGDYRKALYYQEREMQHLIFYQSGEMGLADLSTKISNMCELCLRMKDYPRFQHFLEQLNQSPARSKLDKGRQFYRRYDYLLSYYADTGDFDKATDLTRDIETGLVTFKKQVHQSRIISMYYGLARAYHGKGDYRQALKWVNKILDDRQADLRMDLLCAARILHVLIHYELDNYSLMEHLIKSARHFISKNKRLYPFERSVLKYLLRLSEETDHSIPLGLLESFRAELTAQLSDVFTCRELDYFNWLAWIVSKSRNISFAEAIQETQGKETFGDAQKQAG